MRNRRIGDDGDVMDCWEGISARGAKQDRTDAEMQGADADKGLGKGVETSGEEELHILNLKHEGVALPGPALAETDVVETYMERRKRTTDAQSQA
jgi:hypothetical protein